MFEKDSIIFLAQADNAPMIEHLVKVKDYDEKTGLLTTDKSVTIFKSDKGVQPVPDFGSASVQPNLANGNSGEIVIDTKRFDIMGKVTNTKILDIFNSVTNKLIVNPDKKQTGLLGV